ncbi:hypothetical protein Cgig2_002056 [Carnegiea gigantea]|uniref:Uncharacterized protein n=1 Tax=Carnegiea gigantea TaxID=171969 RepID=A0A9Q1JXB2_9CARY|nr:hypothetical protein Cgig2_002056 [Carnegiea gigantea]
MCIYEMVFVFQNTLVRHIDDDSLDHLPIMLKSNPCRARSQRYAKKFNFENMWVLDPSRRETIQNGGQAICKVKLSITFWVKLRGMQRNLLFATKSHFAMWDTNYIHCTLKEIRECRQKEEIMWWQWAMADFRKYGNLNTRASMRRAQNSISKIQDVDGITHLGPEAIEQIVVNYFSLLFSKDDDLRIEISCHWLSRPSSLRVMTYKLEASNLTLVSDLIYSRQGQRREEIIRAAFFPCDVAMILSIPLSCFFAKE